MGKKVKRWPMWRFAAGAVVCAAGSVFLLWLSVFTERATVVPGAAPDTPKSALSLPTLIMAFGVGALILSVLCVVWLVMRIRDARIPPWERGRKKRRR